MISSKPNILERDRLLLIESAGESAEADTASGGQTDTGLADTLRDRYQNCTLVRTSSLLEGIDELAHHGARAVIVHVNDNDPQLAHAVSALREAAGKHARVLLCCPVELEPHVREVAQSGADDYLLLPIDHAELDTALGFVGTADIAKDTPANPTASMEELSVLSELLAQLGQDGFSNLGRLADLVRLAMGSESVTVVADGTTACSGGTVVEPVLIEQIKRGTKTIGQICVGTRALPYRSADVEKLKHYARLTSHLLDAAANQRSWRHEALTDEVSGLHNRRYALRLLNDLLKRAKKERFRVTVLLFDIDNFKSYNDSFGHAAGDEIIRTIGQLFQSHCRDHDIVTRYGGDEFCVIFWDADQPRVAGSTHPSDALSVLKRFQKELLGWQFESRKCESWKCESLRDVPPGSLTISGGLASFPWDASTAEELIAQADHALLRAKDAGKNRVLIFGEHTDTPSTA
ncbi:MAG: diguanylate cyclase [Planctomycetes bacterium]|nr:diguanylate cyclase [Planctomycetota bacterium]